MSVVSLGSATLAHPLLAADDFTVTASDPHLVIATLLAIGTVVVLITWAKMHPFLALILGSAVLGLAVGLPALNIIAAFQKGVGDTVGSVGVLIALGAMIGGLLRDSGGADRIVNAVVDNVSHQRLPWAMAGVAALLGLPLFFEVGVVLLIPVILLISKRSNTNLMLIGIPALAGLSVLHGLVPPHPGPLAAIAALQADLGRTLIFGLIIAIPTVIISGPVFATFIARYVHADPPSELIPSRELASVGASSGGSSAEGVRGGDQRDDRQGRATSGPGGTTDDALGDPDSRRGRMPALWPAVGTILLPIVLMLSDGIMKIVSTDATSTGRRITDVIGNPTVALLAGVILAMFTLGLAAGFGKQQITDSVGGSLPAIAGILLIVAAGGGFKQTLVSSGVSEFISNQAKGSSLSPLILAWLVAVGIRLATGSATVATLTAAGIVLPLAEGMSTNERALLVLAVGAGSLFFSHVNDAGFWLVKQYFGLTVGQTIKSWSVMETLISVVGLIGVLLLNLIV